MHICTKVRMLSSTFGILFYCSVVRKFRKTVHTIRERYAAFHEALPPLWNRSFAIRTWATLPYKCDQIVLCMARRRLYCCQNDRFATRPCMASVSDQIHFLYVSKALIQFTKRSICSTASRASFMHRSRVGVIKYFLCMSRRRSYYCENDRYAHGRAC